jgi:hypothetical protein
LALLSFLRVGSFIFFNFALAVTMLDNIPVLRDTPLSTMSKQNNDKEFCSILMKAHPTFHTVLACVKQDWAALLDVPDMLLTRQEAYEIAMAAVKQNGLVLEFIISSNFTKEQYAEIATAAIAQNAAAREFVEERVIG